ncbi:MAG: hypothetical protein ACI93L_003680 [Cyclobacteriaceae bacterium]|jgi:hypothetical protein
MYETLLGFRSASLSHVTKRNLKTKLQIYTGPQPCFIHFVGGSFYLSSGFNTYYFVEIAQVSCSFGIIK